MQLAKAGLGTRIRTQITILVFLTGVTSSGLVALLFLILQSGTGTDLRVQMTANRVAPLLRTLDALAPASRALVVENLRDQVIQIDFGRLVPTS